MISDEVYLELCDHHTVRVNLKAASDMNYYICCYKIKRTVVWNCDRSHFRTLQESERRSQDLPNQEISSNASVLDNI